MVNDNIKAELVLDARNGTGESPVWHGAEQALYWVDIPARTLCRWTPATGESRSWLAPEMLACVARMGGSNGWIAGAESGIFSLHFQDDGQLGFESLAPVSHAMPGMRFNDGRCDRQGRFLAGTMLMNMAAGASAGCIYSYQNSSGLTPLLEGFITPNGMAFSPDGCTMYLSDSHPSVQLVWAYDYDIETGTPSNRRLFIDMNPLPGRPDGAAVDADGCYWICGNDAGLIHRFTPEGKLDRSLAVPVKKPAMCAFGGAGLDTLFVTSIRPEGIDLSDQPLAGGVFALRPGVRGLPEPVFSPVPVHNF
jgi:sugar lactone lactonase YvrE